jgi:hypothetical protein
VNDFQDSFFFIDVDTVCKRGERERERERDESLYSSYSCRYSRNPSFRDGALHSKSIGGGYEEVVRLFYFF